MIIGDSLVQGYGLPQEDGFVRQLNKKLIDEIDDIKLEKYLSNHLDSDEFTESNGKNYSEICSLLRQMGVNAYKLTEYVMTNKLGFVPIPGYYDGNVDV